MPKEVHEQAKGVEERALENLRRWVDTISEENRLLRSRIADLELQVGDAQGP